MDQQELDELNKMNASFEEDIKTLIKLLAELIKNEKPRVLAKMAGINSQGRPTSVYQIQKWRTALSGLDDEKCINYLMREISVAQMLALTRHVTDFFNVTDDDNNDECDLNDYRQTDADQLVAIVSDKPLEIHAAKVNFLIVVTDRKTAEVADRLNWMAKVFTDLYQMPLPFKNGVAALLDLGVIKDVVAIDDAAAAISVNDSPVDFIDDAMSFDEVIEDQRTHQMPAKTRTTYEKYFKGEK